MAKRKKIKTLTPIQKAEKDTLAFWLKKLNGNVTNLAAVMLWSRPTVYKRLEKYGLR